MATNKHFNITRFKNIVKREFLSYTNRNLLIIGAMYSLFTIIMFLVFQLDDTSGVKVDADFHFWVFTSMLFTGGVFICSLSFIELRSKMKAHFQLLLPGSSFEKFLANLLISLVVYTLFMFVSYNVYSYIFNWAASALYSMQYQAFDFTNSNFQYVIGIFIIVHSIFFLGSISFKKYPLIITPIAVFLVLILGSFASELVNVIVFPGIDLEDKINNMGLEQVIEFYKIASRIIVFYILPPIFWYITYLKLKEKEY